MPTNNLIRKITVKAALLSTLIVWSSEMAQAQPRTHSLLDAKCVNSGLGSARENKLNVSIGRAVYTSKFYLGPGNRSAAITCKIKPDRAPEPVFQTLNLGFGIRDNDTNSPPVSVNIYLDGQKIGNTYSVSPGKTENVPLDVSNASNVSIEAVCSTSDRHCDRVYFYEAKLEPKLPLTQK